MRRIANGAVPPREARPTRRTHPYPFPVRVFAPDIGPWPVRVLRWAARAASVASLGLLTAFATSGGDWPSPQEWLMIALFPLGVALGTALAWRHEVLGGLVATASLAAFYGLVTAVSGEWPGWWFTAFAAPGIALLPCGLVARAVARRTVAGAPHP